MSDGFHDPFNDQHEFVIHILFPCLLRDTNAMVDGYRQQKADMILHHTPNRR